MNSAELLEALLKAPADLATASTKYLFQYAERKGVELFIRSCDLPPEVEDRLLAMVRGERFQEVTVPFVFYLYELYGAPQKVEPVESQDLAYEEPPVRGEPAGGVGSGLAELVRQSPRLRQHVRRMLELCDALFLQVKPGATAEELPLEQRYEEAAYRKIQSLARESVEDLVGRLDDALTTKGEENKYRAVLEDLIRDPQRFADLVEFLTDLIRQRSESWLESYVERERRKEVRRDWVEDRMNANRYYEISDYAGTRAERRLAVHVVVDGLQGKLLEGLVQLSSGEREGSGARYVAELVRAHQVASMNPKRYGTKLPPALGRDVVALVEQAPRRPDYLENFKKYIFAPTASAVTVNVATVDTPSISIRNLPIIESGQPVAGPNGTGIPNFSYLDRRTGRGWYFWGSDVLYVPRIFENRENLFAGGQKRPEGLGARTLFQRLSSYSTFSSMATVDTGALEKIASDVGIAMEELQRNYIEKVFLMKLRRRAQVEQELNRRRRWLQEHRHLNRSFLGSLLFDSLTRKTFQEAANYVAEHEDEGLPDYLLWYNPWPDHYAHLEGPYSDAIIGFRGEYDRLDFYLGKLIHVYESLQTADGRSNYLDRTLFGLVSDHGLIYTPKLVSTDRLLFDSLRSQGIRLTYQKLTHDEGDLPAIQGRHRTKPTRPFDAVVGSTAGGSYVIDLFPIEGLRGNGAAWQQHPDYHELRRHTLLSGQTIDWVQILERYLGQDMDLALLREYGPSPGQRWPDGIESAVRLVTAGRGEARILRLGGKGADGPSAIRYRYEILGKQDPLDLAGAVRDYLIPPGGPSVEQVRREISQCIAAPEGCDDPVWQRLLSYTGKPDVVYQYSHLYDTERSGTVNLFPADHVGMNSEVPGRHAGETFGEKNGTQLYFGAGLRRASVQTARNGSLPVTLYHWLVGNAPLESEERTLSANPAFGYRSLLEELAFSPLRLARL